mgnify:CR=1 FL=1
MAVITAMIEATRARATTGELRTVMAELERRHPGEPAQQGEHGVQPPLAHRIAGSPGLR